MIWRYSSDLYLKLNYESGTVKEMLPFTGRTEKAVYERVRKLGIQKIPNWTEDETDTLFTHGPYESSKLLKRSYNSCLIKKCRLCKKNKKQPVPRT